VDRNFSRQMLEPSISFDLGIRDASRSVFELPPHFSSDWANNKQAFLKVALPRTAVHVHAAAGIISQSLLPSPPFCNVLLIVILPSSLTILRCNDTTAPPGHESRAPPKNTNTMTTPSQPVAGIALYRNRASSRQTCAVGNTPLRAAIEDL
jgi:hypothetical protein